MTTLDARLITLVIAVTLGVGVLLGWVGLLIGPGAAGVLEPLAIVVGVVLIIGLLAATWIGVSDDRDSGF